MGILIYFITKINKHGKKFFMHIHLQKKWLIYILECRDGSLYCGITNNIEKRLKQHKGEIKGGAKYTHSHWPCKLVYEEKSVSRSKASQREAIIKKMSKVEKQTLINSYKQDSS
jgi:putative endonuclease